MDEVTHRDCKSCGETKPLLKFHKNGNRGRHSICAVCRNIKRKGWDKSWKKRPGRIFKEYQRGAFNRGLKFDLSEKAFFSFQNSSCHYCGSKLEQIRLDRVDNKIGYNISNVVPCCALCNFFKHTLGKEDFLEHISKIYLFQKG